MKRADLRPGMTVGYRWPEWVTHSGPAVADAVIVDPAWPVPADCCYEGERVQTSGMPAESLILFRLPGHRPELRAIANAAHFVSGDAIERHRRNLHFDREGIDLDPGGPTMMVALIDPASRSTWEPVLARLDSTGRLIVRVGSGEDRDDVDPRHLLGPAWIAMQADRRRRAEAVAAERARRAALKADTAERLGLSRDAVSLGALGAPGEGFIHYHRAEEEVLLVISPAALAGLIDRAMSDPAWADQIRGEGVLDALAGLGGN